MIIDAHTIPDRETIQSDLCIIGAGPAGITLAHELNGTDLRVCLLEGGGMGAEREYQSLAADGGRGGYFLPLDVIRRRQFGGTANGWQVHFPGDARRYVRLAPLDQIDFLPRPWVPLSGWPFTLADLQPYYARVHQRYGLGTPDYEPAAWTSREAPFLPFDPAEIQTRMYHFLSNAVFTTEARQVFETSENLSVYYHAVVVELLSEVDGRVTQARIGRMDGSSFTVNARAFVLAVGGVETPRLLLDSRSSQPQGLGNEHGVVGRYFMDHFLARSALWRPSDPAVFNQTSLYDLRTVGGSVVTARLDLTESTQQREKLLNTHSLLFPRHRGFESEAIYAAKQLVFPDGGHRFSRAALPHLQRVLAGMPDLTRAGLWRLLNHPPFLAHLDMGGWSQLPDKTAKFTQFEIAQITEQVPDPENRVTLSAETDRLGLPLPVLHWRAGALDQDTLLRSRELLAEAVHQAGLGTVLTERAGADLLITNPTGSHHLGTTRMNPDPKQGVVDYNCRVHAARNLFIASGSVFPTGGAAPPTLTILALSVRLGDHIKQQFYQKAFS